MRFWILCMTLKSSFCFSRYLIWLSSNSKLCFSCIGRQQLKYLMSYFSLSLPSWSFPRVCLGNRSARDFGNLYVEFGASLPWDPLFESHSLDFHPLPKMLFSDLSTSKNTAISLIFLPLENWLGPIIKAETHSLPFFPFSKSWFLLYFCLFLVTLQVFQITFSIFCPEF